jgi:hypothetical protein
MENGRRGQSQSSLIIYDGSCGHHTNGHSRFPRLLPILLDGKRGSNEQKSDASLEKSYSTQMTDEKKTPDPITSTGENKRGCPSD